MCGLEGFLLLLLLDFFFFLLEVLWIQILEDTCEGEESSKKKLQPN